jgi:hypothetical protein
MSNFEVITTVDKVQRDAMFEDFRENGNELELQVVKFSSNQPVLDENGEQAFIVSSGGHRKGGLPQFKARRVFQSTWSVAYPRS